MMKAAPAAEPVVNLVLCNKIFFLHFHMVRYRKREIYQSLMRMCCYRGKLWKSVSGNSFRKINIYPPKEKKPMRNIKRYRICKYIAYTVYAIFLNDFLCGIFREPSAVKLSAHGMERKAA